MAKMTDREMTVIGKTQQDNAIKFASMENEVLSSAIKEQMEAKEVTESGSIRILIAMKASYGDKLAEFPRPGSTVEDSNNPDVIKVEKVNSSTGNKSVVNSSWYVTFADNTLEGKAILQELGWIKILRNLEADHNLVPNEFRQAYPNNEEWKVREGYLTGRRNTIRSAYKKAMALLWQFEDVNALAKVSATFKWADANKTKVVNTKVPVRISDDDNADTWQYVSLSTFMRFDTAKAQEQGGTFQALIDSLKRDSDKQGGGVAAPQKVRTADTFAARITDIHEALDYAFTDKDGKKLHNDIEKALSAAGSDDLLLSVADIHDALGDLLKSDKLQVRLQTLRDNREAA